MNRYWIAREIHGKNKLVIPSVVDLSKYSKPEEIKKAGKDPFQYKMELCAAIISKRHKFKDSVGLANIAKLYMNKSIDDLLKIKHTIGA